MANERDRTYAISGIKSWFGELVLYPKLALGFDIF